MQQIGVGFELSQQQKLLFDLYPDPSASFVSLVVKLRGQASVERLENAVEKIVGRHEILRTTYQRGSGMRYPVQVISPTPSVFWQRVDIRTQDAQMQNRAITSACESIQKTVDGVLHASIFHISKSQQILVFKFPALSADEATLRNFMVELSEFYLDPEANIEEALQYADYAQWQMDRRESCEPDDVTGNEYWDSRDLAILLDLPFSQKVDGNSQSSEATVTIPVEPAVLEHLQRAPNSSATLLAAWQVLLWRLTRVSRFTLGFKSSGRTHDDFNGAFGPFSKTLPLTADFDRDLPFSDLVQTAHEEMRRAEQWQDCFSPRKAAYTPSVGFSFHDTFPDRSAAGVTFSISDIHCPNKEFDLELRCRIGDGESVLELAYNRQRFWIDGAERIARAFSALLSAAIANPETPVSLLPILDREESRHILVEFNRTSSPYSDSKCIHHLFEEHATLTPTRLALRYGLQTLTYGELNKQANQVAHFLQSRGVGPNVPVGLCTERSLEMIVGLLAILKAGGCYVPLIPDQPKARLLHQISETKALVTLTQQSFATLFTGSDTEVMCLDVASETFSEQPCTNPQTATGPNDLAYVIYTSGSTGQPKGVAVRHSSLVNYSECIAHRVRAYESAAGLNFATVSTIGADLGNTCIFPSLISGGCLHVIAYETAMDAGLFADYVAHHPIDILKITPSHLSALLRSSQSGVIWPATHLFLGGEVLTWDLLAQIQAASACAVVNHYGPTEATVGCCMFEVNENDVSAWVPATVPIGRPLPNTEIYIFDEHSQPLPIGVAGELCVGGIGLSQGYFNQPEQTKTKFIAHPFSKDATARLYRTGDLARFLPDGNVEFFGRIDHQIKIRGFRVEPGEIQAAIEKHPDVSQAVVLPYSEDGENRLAAYIASKAHLTAAGLRAFLLPLLPEYMIPSRFVTLDRFPLNANGKLDVYALTEARETTVESAHRGSEPRTPEETKLAAIWSEVLKKPCLDVHASFFLLGGHSLLAAQIVARIRDTFNVQFPLHSFLQTPTIAELAPKIAQYPSVEKDNGLERILATLDSLSEEEAQQLLAEMERQA